MSAEKKQPHESTQDQKPSGGSNQWFFVILIVAVVVFWGIRNPSSALRVMAVLLGFGGIVMIHELGHFIFAKLGGIKVEAFSIGFPPVILGIRKLKKGWRVRLLPKPNEEPSIEEGDNDTEYQIGLFPIGGFVKMLGQSDTGAADACDDPRSYTNRPISARIATVAAGVVFNAIGAIIIFIFLFMNGIDLPPAIVGGVMPNSPAADAGLKPGDEIVKINGDDFVDFAALQMAPAISSPGEQINFEVRHLDGTEETVKVVAETRGGSADKMRYTGISQTTSMTVNTKLAEDPNAVDQLFASYGLRPGDEVKAVNGVSIKNPWDFNKIIAETYTPEVQISVSRHWPPDLPDDQKSIETVTLPLWIPLVVSNFRDEYDLSHFGSLIPRLKIDSISSPTKKQRFANWLRTKILRKDSLPSVKNILLAGDILLKAGDVEYPNFKQLREVTTANKDMPLSLIVLRKDINGIEQELELTVTPTILPGSKRVTIGFMPTLDLEQPIVGHVLVDSQQASMAPSVPSGARIISVDGKPVENFYQIASILKDNAGNKVSVEYEFEGHRGGTALIISEHEPVHARTALLVSLPFAEYTQQYKATNPFEAVQMGVKKVWQFIYQNYQTLARIVKRDIDTSQLMGPIGIVSISYKATGYSLDRYLYLLGLISSCLAVMNLLPLPVLDGGHIIFLIIEKITGKPVHEKILAPIMYAGLALLMTLILWVTYNDLMRIIFGG